MPDAVHVRIYATDAEFHAANPWDPDFAVHLDTTTLHTLRRVVAGNVLMRPLSAEMADAITQELARR